MLRRAFCTGVLVVAITVHLAAPAHAAPAKALRCAVSSVITFSPGITQAAQGGTFSGTGTATCQRQPASPPTVSGPIAFSGTTAPTDTCALGAGSGTLSANLAGSDGSTLLLSARFTFLRTGMLVAGPVTGTDDDTGFGNLALGLVPRVGQTCATTAITRASVLGVLELTGTVR